jgi:hypothetical protein
MLFDGNFVRHGQLKQIAIPIVFEDGIGGKLLALALKFRDSISAESLQAARLHPIEVRLLRATAGG